MLELIQPQWVRRMMKLPRVQPAQAHLISQLAQRLSEAIAPSLHQDDPKMTPLHLAALGLAEYLDGNLECPQHPNLIPPPRGWDPDHACSMLGAAMYAFETASVTDPRDQDEERTVRTLAYELALEIAEAGWRNDPGGLLDKVVQGRISEIPEPRA